jgi:hypothetical protein
MMVHTPLGFGLTKVFQILPPPQKQKRKRTSNGETGDKDILTPGSYRLTAPQSSRPSTADNFQKLFPSSPLSHSETKAIPVRLGRQKSIIEIEDTPQPNSESISEIQDTTGELVQSSSYKVGGIEDPPQPSEDASLNCKIPQQYLLN